MILGIPAGKSAIGVVGSPHLGKSGEWIMVRKIRLWFSPETSPFFYLLPVFLFMGLMVAYPIGRMFYLSMTQNILTRPDLGVTFVGLDNYIALFNSADFWRTIERTVGWTVISVVGKSLIGFCIAWLLAKKIAFKRFYLFLLLIPWVTPMVVGAVAWRWVYDGQYGMLNWLLMEAKLLAEPFAWLGHKGSAFFATAIVDMWHGIPFMAMIFLAGIQAIPEQLLESADIDGASPVQRLCYVILPLMKPIIVVATMLSIIWTFNSFGIIWPLTKGGPVDATEILIINAYKRSFGAFDLGMGAAVTMVIFLLLLLFTAVYYRFMMKQENF